MMKKLISLFLSLLMLFTLTVTVLAYDVSSADYYVYVKASDGGVNIRSGPSTSYEKLMTGMIPNGTELYISAQSGNWGYTTYNGITGWIALSATTKSASAKSSSQPVQTTQAGYYVYVKASDGGVNFRSGPSKSYGKVMSGMIPNGERLYISEVSGKWGVTTYNGITGWIALSETTKTAPSTNTASTTKSTKTTSYYVYVKAYDGGLNLRIGPSVNYAKVMPDWIPNDTEIHITAVSGNWGYTSYQGYSGWVNLKYTTTKQPQIKQETKQEQVSGTEENPEEEYFGNGIQGKKTYTVETKRMNIIEMMLDNPIYIWIIVALIVMIIFVVVLILIITQSSKNNRR